MENKNDIGQFEKDETFNQLKEACDELQLVVLGKCVNGGELGVWDWVNGGPFPKTLNNLDVAKQIIIRIRTLHESIPHVWNFCGEPVAIDDFKKMYIEIHKFTGQKMYGIL